MDEDANTVEQRLRIVKRNRGSIDKDATSDGTGAVDPPDKHYPRCMVTVKVQDNKTLSALVLEVVDKTMFPDFNLTL